MNSTFILNFGRVSSVLAIRWLAKSVTILEHRSMRIVKECMVIRNYIARVNSYYAYKILLNIEILTQNCVEHLSKRSRLER